MSEDWPVEEAEDWLSTDDTAPRDSEKPASNDLVPLSAAALAQATDRIAEQAKFISAWQALSDGQQVFLNTWRECRFNGRKATRVLANTSHSVSHTTVMRWQSDDNYEYVRGMMRAASVSEILSRDYLALRHEDIVETLMTPKPILHQGVQTGHYEVEAGAAGKANEVLLRMGGHLKDKETELNVAIGPSFTIQVVQRDGTVIDATPRYVDVNLPAPEDGA